MEAILEEDAPVVETAASGEEVIVEEVEVIEETLLDRDTLDEILDDDEEKARREKDEELWASDLL